MVKAWMPDAERVEGAPFRAVPRGGAPRTVWLTNESDPGLQPARAAAARLLESGRTAHLVWNPVTGETTQLLPATSAATGILTTGTVDRSEEGRVCVLILVVGRELAPFTDGPLVGLAEILRWLDSWEVARLWPAGAPEAARGILGGTAQQRTWARGGHFAHCQVPGSRSTSPGPISPDRILNFPAPESTPASRPPAPRRGGGHSQRTVNEDGFLDPPTGAGRARLDMRPRIEALPS